MILGILFKIISRIRDTGDPTSRASEMLFIRMCIKLDVQTAFIFILIFQVNCHLGSFSPTQGCLRLYRGSLVESLLHWSSYTAGCQYYNDCCHSVHQYAGYRHKHTSAEKNE